MGARVRCRFHEENSGEEACIIEDEDQTTANVCVATSPALLDGAATWTIVLGNRTAIP